MGESSFKAAVVSFANFLSIAKIPPHLQRAAAMDISNSGINVAASEPGENRVASTRFLANIAIVASRQSVLVFEESTRYLVPLY